MDARYRRHMLCRQQLPEGVAILRLLVVPGCYVRSLRINITESAAGEQPADVASDAAGKDQDRAEVRPDVVAVTCPAPRSTTGGENVNWIAPSGS